MSYQVTIRYTTVPFSYPSQRRVGDLDVDPEQIAVAVHEVSVADGLGCTLHIEDLGLHKRR